MFMNSLVLLVVSFLGYIAAYRIYGKYLSRKIFRLNNNNNMPSKTNYDGIDYIPTKRKIAFGHHFTTIAGVGPIVGPAIGVIWGWLPALLWIFFGSIFIGAVHDFLTMVISARNNGKSIADLTQGIIGKQAMIAFQLILQILLLLVLSVFALIVSNLFVMYPETVIPVWFQIPISLWLGKRLKTRNRNSIYILIALILLYVSIIIGIKYPIDLNRIILLISPEFIVTENQITVIWCLLLFVYMFFASTIAVDKLLQPRDFINSQQLLLVLGLLIIAIFISHPQMSAPTINSKAFEAGNDVPTMVPLLFIVIACGAISGFHSIASSGTTIKQVEKEQDMLAIGYGSMLTEGGLAIIVLICVTAGIGLGIKTENIVLTGFDSFNYYYSSWLSRNAGMAAKLDSFVQGAVNLLSVIKIPRSFAQSLIAVFIVSFATTTLDSATRMQRITLSELLVSKRKKRKYWFKNRYVTTIILLFFAAVLTFLKPGGKGALMLWPLFGSLNQLLAALGLIVVTIYLFLKKKNIYIAFVPMVFMLVITLWAMVSNITGFITQKDNLLIFLSLIIILLTLWLLISGINKIIQQLKQKS